MCEFSEETLSVNGSSLAGNGSSSALERPEDLTLDSPAGISPENLAVDHAAIVRNERLFYEKLREFRAVSDKDSLSLDAEGKVSDLYILYKEVTARGGLERVVEEKRLDEIASALNLKSSISNPAFLLQQHYKNLLYQFEQVHFFQEKREQSLPGLVPVLLDKKSSNRRSKKPSTQKGKRKSDPSSLSASMGTKQHHIGKTVTGTIETEFDGGYAVTVTVGSQKLSGLLFRALESKSEKHCAIVPGVVNNADSPTKSEPVEQDICVNRSKRKQNSSAKKKRGAPRGLRSAFHFFSSAQYKLLREKHKGPSSEILKMARDAWKCLSESEKKPYIEMSRKDKERYHQETKAYLQLQKDAQADEEKQEETLSGETAINSVDGQAKQAKKHRPCHLGDDDCYRVKLDMEVESSDSTSTASTNVQSFLNDLFFSGKFKDDAELLDYIARSWGAMGDFLSELPLVGNALT